MIGVLIADDHAFIRAGVEAVLRGTRYNVVATASDGNAALVAVARHDPAIVILDIQMPGRDGVAVLEALRARGDKRPVVLLTAQLDDRRLLAAVKAGVDGIVLKDGAEDNLIACLDEVHGGRRAIDPGLLQRALQLSIDGLPLSPLDPLTPREREIAGLVAQGLRNREIGQQLNMSEGTVKVSLHGIYQKLGIDNRTALAVLALEAGGATPPARS